MNKRSLLSIAGVLFASASAFALTPTFDTFGTLAGATFGGSGISNTAVAMSTFDGVTLGLTATGRYANPAVSYSGGGVFSAQAGADSSPSSYGLWNFDFYASNAGSNTYTLELWYDFDPASVVSTSLAGLGRVLPTASLASGVTQQDSWNLGMAFLNTTAVYPTATVIEPSYASFDPNASGEYSFALVLKDSNQTEVTRVAINVNTTASVPDSGSTLVMLGLAMAAIGTVSRRRRA